jgi:uncharacterized protein YndB with AHSA1/START domain
MKTQVNAVDGKQEMLITREFDLPLELLFKAYEDPEIVGEWMGTKVLKMENRKYGGYEFQTSDDKGNVVFKANGTVHDFVPNERITRTFEMENTPFGAQLEFLEFEKLTDETSRLKMHIVYRTVEIRDQFVQFGMGKGMNMAHNRLQEVVSKLKQAV